MRKIFPLLFCFIFPISALGINREVPDIFHKAKALDLMVAIQNFNRVAQSDSIFAKLEADSSFLSDIADVNSCLRASNLCNFYMEFNGNPDSIEECAAFWQSDTLSRQDSQPWAEQIMALRPKISKVINGLVDAGYSSYWADRVSPQLDEYLDKYKISDNRLDSLQSAFLDFAGPDSLSDAKSKIYIIDVSNAAFALPNESFCCSAILLDPEIQKQVNLNFLSLYLHENLHRLPLSRRLMDLVEELKKKDTFYAMKEAEAKQHHEGGNEAFVVAAECYLSNKLGIRSDAEVRQTFREYVDGALVLVPIIYRYLPEKRHDQSFNNFLISLFDSGKIKAGEIERQYREALSK